MVKSTLLVTDPWIGTNRSLEVIIRIIILYLFCPFSPIKDQSRDSN